MNTLKEFKAFLLRGNIVDLAVAVVVGTAFNAVVTSLVKNMITPLLAIGGETDFSQLKFAIGKSSFMYGAFINDVIAFLSIAAAVFFFVVKPMNRIMGMTKKTEEPQTKECPECLSEIPLAARKCAHCTSKV